MTQDLIAKYNSDSDTEDAPLPHMRFFNLKA